MQDDKAIKSVLIVNTTSGDTWKWKANQLTWECKLATVNSFKVCILKVSPLSKQMNEWITTRRANAQNISFETLYSGQFMLSTQLIILNYPVILSHWCNTTVSLETFPLYSQEKLSLIYQVTWGKNISLSENLYIIMVILLPTCKQ